MLPPGSRQFDRQFDSSSLDNLLATSQKSWLLTICRTYWVPVVVPYDAEGGPTKKRNIVLANRQTDLAGMRGHQKIKSVSVKSVCRSVKKISKKSNRSTDSSTDRFESVDTLFEMWTGGLDYWYLQNSPCGLFWLYTPNPSTYRHTNSSRGESPKYR